MHASISDHAAFATTLDKRRGHWLQVGLVLSAGLLAFWNSLYGAFVFDDTGHIVNSGQVRELWPISTWLANNARPVVTLTLALNYHFDKLNPRGYHVVNLLIHLTAALTLFGIIRRTLSRIADCGSPLASQINVTGLQNVPHPAGHAPDPTDLTLDTVSVSRVSTFHSSAGWLSCVVCLIWVVHPLQTQSVTYIIQRGESLMGLLYLLTLYGFIRAVEAPGSRGWIWHLVSILACALGLASKAVMVAAPILVLLYDRIFVARTMGEIVRRRWAYYLGLCFTLVVIQLVGLFNSVLNPNPGYPVSVGFGVANITMWEYLRTQPEAILHYLRLVFWPHPLCLNHEWTVAQSGYYAKGLVILLMLAATAVLLWKRPRLGFIAASFFIFLGPSSSFIPVKDLAMEHRMYLPLASVIMLVVLGMYTLLMRMAAKRLPAHLLAGSAALVFMATSVLAVATHQRNKAYYSGLELWQDVVDKSPDGFRGRYNLGNALYAADRFEEAVEQYRAAARIDLPDHRPHYNMANALMRLGRREEAIQEYLETINRVPNHEGAREALSREGLIAVPKGR